MHSDDEPLSSSLNVVIVSLSLGGDRLFQLQRIGEGGQPKGIELPSGSLLVMHGLMHNHFKHGLPAGTVNCEPRYNLTWRFIVNHSCSGFQGTHSSDDDNSDNHGDGSSDPHTGPHFKGKGNKKKRKQNNKKNNNHDNTTTQWGQHGTRG